MSFTEIAERLGLSRQAASNAYYSGMRKLRRNYGKDVAGLLRWIEQTRRKAA